LVVVAIVLVSFEAIGFGVIAAVAILESG
jgi:hypothetical protein